MIKKLSSLIVVRQIIYWLRELRFRVQIKLAPRNHRKAIKTIRKKEKIKIAFFILKSSVWKFEVLYRLLKNDTRFEPIIVICPYNSYGHRTMLRHMKQAYSYFKNNGYNVVKTLDEESGRWLDVKKEINPDIVFFSVHWDLTRKEYQIQNFNKILTCYSTYTFVISHLYEGYFNGKMQNLVWKFFLETNLHQQLAKKHARNRGINTYVSGYPGMDELMQKSFKPVDAWKIKDSKVKRIIWSPHHTINGHEASLNYSTFLKYSEFMFDLAARYQNQIQIAFKPHPILRSKLSLNEVWGKEKTETYFQKWANLPNGQLNEGEYIDLFATSDGMINDSSAFVIEYLYTGKPMMFLEKDKDVAKRMNNIGEMALNKLYIGKHKNDIELFINNVIIKECDTKQNERIQFFQSKISPSNNLTASENIYNHIRTELFGLSELS
ncbi:CDP-Glycerol:Poly(glycerophosphate) glycerophosphotransferase [Mariniphaga anaerophila]|uniref:CDP-Glycerol:Poly(Glycerophosphate) glycerophosphotransferase n=1 Tax=Mariniphaga anaerophila TaxID=1484053 RepID=A0A1M5BM97_9BACT|nr:CDP-glycerol glycerophosphotransferase family protein [Mariniphaga anaerophila]SHF43342.1 CDP-Glycerol:Poly(glycerophosphate) glycerophosphotransferase [Mariniphaga anaerophila]